MAESNKINEHTIKFRRTLNIPEPIKTGVSYRIALDVDIKGAEKILNDDGTYDLIFKAEIEKGEVLKETGEIIMSKSNDSQSQKLRKQIFAMNEEYDEILNIIRHNLEDIIQRYKSK